MEKNFEYEGEVCEIIEIGHVHTYILDQEAKTKEFSQSPSVKLIYTKTYELIKMIKCVLFLFERCILGIRTDHTKIYEAIPERNF